MLAETSMCLEDASEESIDGSGHIEADCSNEEGCQRMPLLNSIEPTDFRFHALAGRTSGQMETPVLNEQSTVPDRYHCEMAIYPR